MQDMEFTIERGKLYMLQTRNGKRTAAAAASRSPSTWWTRA
jgi:pyruvate,orthophosphate dikinase